MSKYSKINVISKLQKWMDSENGQTFLNYAYSWGASIVILGTLFKLTHMPSANFWLFLGMGTEVLVFFISAFDRPFTKGADTDDSEETTEVQQQYGAAPSFSPEIEDLARRVGMMPDNEDTRMFKEIFNSIYDVYKQQLVKLHGQLDSIDKIGEQMKIQAAYMTELNKIYGRMLDAVKVKE